MTLFETVKRFAVSIGVPEDVEFSRSVHTGLEYFSTINISKLQFHVYQHQISGQFVIKIPLAILDYIIVGWEGCVSCKVLAEWIPEMDHVTLSDTHNGMVATKIKTMLPKSSEIHYPILLHKDGKVIKQALDISIEFGFPIQITKGV